MKLPSLVAIVTIALAGCASVNADRPTRILCSMPVPAMVHQATVALIRAGYSITFSDSSSGTIQAERVTGGGSMSTGGKWQVTLARQADTLQVRVTTIERVYNGTTAVMTWSEENARGETRQDLLAVLEPLRALCNPNHN
jgi:hypothetical protein